MSVASQIDRTQISQATIFVLLLGWVTKHVSVLWEQTWSRLWYTSSVHKLLPYINWDHSTQSPSHTMENGWQCYNRISQLGLINAFSFTAINCSWQNTFGASTSYKDLRLGFIFADLSINPPKLKLWITRNNRGMWYANTHATTRTHTRKQNITMLQVFFPLYQLSAKWDHTAGGGHQL